MIPTNGFEWFGWIMLPIALGLFLWARWYSRRHARKSH